MLYLLPHGISNAQEMSFPNAVNIPKNPTGVRGYPMPAKGMGPTLAYKAKKWGNGTNNSGHRNSKARH